jgi:hypothetical protein
MKKFFTKLLLAACMLPLFAIEAKAQEVDSPCYQEFVTPDALHLAMNYIFKPMIFRCRYVLIIVE